MSFFYKFIRLVFGMVAVFAFAFNSNCQVQTPRFIKINNVCKGFYEYLPKGYDGVTRFPLMIFMHGVGESGNGTTELSRVLRYGPPGLINENKFPVSFTVNGGTYKFIIISPQFAGWPTAKDVDSVFEYAKNNYPVDTERMYMTGLSMGGGGTWDFAGENSTNPGQIAAMVAVCGASAPQGMGSFNIASANLPVWATHNNGDPTIPLAYTNDHISQINTEFYKLNPTATQPLAKKTIFNSNLHDAWTQTYDPAFKENGMNVYEWMLQYSRASARTTPLPVTLISFGATVVSRTASLKWLTATEQNDAYFTIERSADRNTFTVKATVPATNNPNGSAYNYIDKELPKGISYYRLSQTDKDGKRTFFNTIKVSITASTGQSLMIFPNPATKYIDLVLNTEEKGHLQVSVIGQDGKLIKTMDYNKPGSDWSERLQIDDLIPGYYLIKTSVGSSVFIKKFIRKE